VAYFNILVEFEHAGLHFLTNTFMTLFLNSLVSYKKETKHNCLFFNDEQNVKLNTYIKGKVLPRIGHEGPEGE
jgi:hypothetical protein